MSDIGIVIVVAFGILAANVIMTWRQPRADSTDPVGGHSGLILYTDSQTGVQYVGTSLGGLTPRVDAEGHVMVSRQVAP